MFGLNLVINNIPITKKSPIIYIIEEESSLRKFSSLITLAAFYSSDCWIASKLKEWLSDEKHWKSCMHYPVKSFILQLFFLNIWKQSDYLPANYDDFDTILSLSIPKLWKIVFNPNIKTNTKARINKAANNLFLF